MFAEPRDLDRKQLTETLKRHWGIRVAALEYLPIGFGSRHWRATDPDAARYFVSVDDLLAGFQAGADADATFDALDRAFRTSAALEEAGLDFVLAPLRDDERRVLRRLGSRYALRVDRFVEGQRGEYGAHQSPEERREMGAVLGRLHAATGRVPSGLPRGEDFALPSRAVLEEALGDLAIPWRSGPFGERARELLRGNARDVERRLLAYDELAAGVRNRSAWVITHGEPHRANVIRDGHGGLHLVDWGTALLAPRERDLRTVLDEDLTGWDEYRAQAGAVALSEEILELYRSWWDLAEIAVYVAGFRRPHEDTEDTRASWTNLNEYLP